MYIDALVRDMVARKKSVVNIICYFLKMQKLVVYRDNCITEIYHCKSVYPKQRFSCSGHIKNL